jgi:hypothetical protein
MPAKPHKSISSRNKSVHPFRYKLHNRFFVLYASAAQNYQTYQSLHIAGDKQRYLHFGRLLLFYYRILKTLRHNNGGFSPFCASTLFLIFPAVAPIKISTFTRLLISFAKDSNGIFLS